MNRPGILLASLAFAIPLLGFTSHARTLHTHVVTVPPLALIQFGPPITPARLKAWKVPGTMLRFRGTTPTGHVINALQAVAAANSGPLSAGYVQAVRFGIATTGTLNARPVWMVIYANADIPSAFCEGSGRAFVPVDPYSGKVLGNFSIAHCRR